MEITSGKVYSFKMNSGEEIIGKLEKIITSATIPYYKISAPLATGMTQQGLQLMPAMFTAELNAEVSVTISSVAMVAEPREDVADAYRESVTGIKVPEKQILLS